MNFSTIEKKDPPFKTSIWSFKQLGGLITFPILMLLFIGLVFLWLNNGHISRDGYWGIQIDWFIELNAFLSTWSSLWLNLTQLGDALVFFPLVSFLIIRQPQAWAAMFGAVPLATFLSIVGKDLAEVPRPAAVLDHNSFVIVGDALTAHNSLPSGHTIAVFAAITAIFGSFIPFPRNKPHWLWLLVAFLVAVFLSLSRIAVGAHWPLDLSVGAMLGFIAGISGVFLTQRYQCWWQWLHTSKYQFIFGIIMLLWCLALIQQALNSPYNEVLILWASASSGLVVSLYLLRKPLKTSYLYFR